MNLIDKVLIESVKMTREEQKSRLKFEGKILSRSGRNVGLRHSDGSTLLEK